MDVKQIREIAFSLVKDEQTPEARLGQHVRELRVAQGLSQAQLAAALTSAGFSWGQTTTTKTEAGDRPIRWNEVVALADALGVKLEDLVKTSAQSTTESSLLDLVRADAAVKAAHARLQAARQEVSEAEQAWEEAMNERRRIQWDQRR